MSLTRIIMPKTGAEMTEGRILAWKKKVGEKIAQGEVLLEIETDKATMEVESSSAGVLVKQLFGDGETVPATQLIAALGTGSETEDEINAFVKAGEEPALEITKAAATEAHSAPVATSPSAPAGKGRVKASPLARRSAEEKGIDLATIQGTGPDGRIEKEDVLRAAEAAPPAAAPGDSSVPLTSMRRAIARQVVRSTQEAPHFSVTLSINMARTVAKRKELEASGKKVSINAILVFAVSRTLGSHPDLNAEFKGDSILRHGDINIGIAVGTDEALYVPVIRDAHRLSLEDIAAASAKLAARARENALNEADLTGGTFTISNLGMFGVDSFTAIILVPQTGVLSVGSIQDMPVRGSNGELQWEPRMSATLTSDHRVVDGLAAAKFLADLKKFLESI